MKGQTDQSGEIVPDGTEQRLAQAYPFNQTNRSTGISLTKLNGTATGGVIFTLANKLALPLRVICVAENINDRRLFHLDEFIDALFATQTATRPHYRNMMLKKYPNFPPSGFTTVLDLVYACVHVTTTHLFSCQQDTVDLLRYCIFGIYPEHEAARPYL